MVAIELAGKVANSARPPNFIQAALLDYKCPGEIQLPS
ncbi:hypothetical protein SBF1_5420009 [Candidatus Desulfosporosinus infrequens]|uniref:Uncharacterized protein n=1 Tax=Candidatus Desulfosporosinus infrequens TaxID=2043169 RepID=A0A2U3LJC2_9FIRM|nr:hypothetical protein SBF1_5420009 [Candidatus Desulfosporosinus infrequens]